MTEPQVPDGPSRWTISLTWEEIAWAAQAHEYDIAAQGSTILAALSNLAFTIEAERKYTLKRHGKAFANIAPYPLKEIQ